MVDGESRALADVTLSDLAQRRDRDCADYCESLTEKAESHEEKLVADYGITAEQLWISSPPWWKPSTP